MGDLLDRAGAIEQALVTLSRRHGVPGAALAILQGDRVMNWVTRLANVRTGVAVTPDTLFQIGSNTKVYTTTLLMQLVDESRIALDAPVRRYVKDLRLADEAAAAHITIRHLLTHSSGIDGDYLEDFGPGDDAIARYIASLRSVGQLHRPGERFSYCNTGFVLAGHVLERVTGQPYHAQLAQRVLKPLGLGETTVLPQEMLGFRYAVGHHVDRQGHPTVANPILLPRALAPAGSYSAASARDVIKFAAMHLADGRAPDGGNILSSESVRAMQHQEYPRAAGSSGRAGVGLGWLLDEWDGHRVIGHDGSTNGQESFLQLLPDEGICVCLLTNGDTGRLLWQDLRPCLFREVAGIRVPPIPRPAHRAPRLTLAAYEGTYRRMAQRFEVTAAGSVLAVKVHTGDGLAALTDDGPPSWHLRPVNAEQFFMVSGVGEEMLVTFADFDASGRPGSLYVGLGRLAVRMPSWPRNATCSDVQLPAPRRAAGPPCEGCL